MSQPPSLALGRPSKSPGRIFLQSQLCTRPKRTSTSLAGKTALITGGSTGLGYHAARHLLSLNLARLILAVRFRSKGDKVAAEFRAAYPAATIEVWELKMGDYDSVLAFARRVEGEFSNSGDSGKTKLDMAILNAGMAGSEFTRNAKTGHCQVVRVNYLSTFLLATVLVPVLRDVKGERPGRLTIVGSGGVFAAKLPNRGQRPFLSSFDDLAVQAWDPMERYFSSKVLGMLFFVRLYDYLPAADQVVVNMVDPGMCKGSELGREATGLTGAVRSVLGMVLGRPVEDGAWTYVDAAVVQGKDLHGSFVRDWKICPFYYAVYEPEGPQLMDTLFEETMAELEFAGVRKRLEGWRK